jgi:Na+/H+-dicarboxylate symporter
MILGMVHVPVEGIGLILGVDRFLDMCRTTLNVTGDLAAAVVVSRGRERAPAPRAVLGSGGNGSPPARRKGPPEGPAPVDGGPAAR